jgi:leucyl/phenylalanyl-tRNA--protein transferase
MENPIRLHWLDPRDPRQPFPPPHVALREPNGLLALGGDLSVTRLVRAYSHGIFPWFNPDEPILWWCPDPRCVLRPQEFKLSRSLAKSVRKADYAVTFNHAFGEVLRSCAAPRSKGHGTWLGGHMQRAYHDLHRHGFCQSMEVWRNGQLVGGLYGVSIGRAFFGESMFSRETDASKIALHWLCRQLSVWNFALMDCQITTPHLLSLGAKTVARERFLTDLQAAVGAGGRTGHWRFDIAVPAARAHLPSP